jgi:hypothetical protein
MLRKEVYSRSHIGIVVGQAVNPQSIRALQTSASIHQINGVPTSSESRYADPSSSLNKPISRDWYPKGWNDPLTSELEFGLLMHITVRLTGKCTSHRHSTKLQPRSSPPYRNCRRYAST